MKKLIALIIALFLGTPSANSSMYFNAVSYANFGSAFNFTSQNFSIAHWIQIYDLSTQPVLFFKGQFQADGYYVQAGSGGNVQIVTNQSGAYQVSGTAVGVLPLSVWTHIAYVRNGASVRIYVNGVDQTSTAGTHINPASSVANFTMGGYNSGATLVPNATYDDVRIYSRALSEPEIQTLALSRSFLLIGPDDCETMKGWYKMDEGVYGQVASGTGMVLDRSGCGNNGTAASNPQYSNSILNYP